MKITAELTKKVTDYVSKMGEEYKVIPTTVAKNNYISEGYVIKKNDEQVCPMVTVNDADSAEDVYDRISVVIATETPGYKVEDMLAKEYILEHLFAQVVSADSPIVDENRVSRKFLDMAVIYRVKVESDDEAMASFTLTNEIIEKAGITEEELFEVVSKRDDYKAQSIFDAIRSLIDDDSFFPVEDDDDLMPIVVTSEDMLFGASVLCTKYLDNLKEKMGEEFYVIPSSLHEVILVKKDNNLDVDEIKNMVMTVNATEVRPEDKLTDTVYCYGKDGLSIAA